MRRIAGAVLAVTLAAVACSGSHAARPAATSSPASSVVKQTARQAASNRAARLFVREQRQLRQQARANRPRMVEYFLKGTTNGATITYTSTGNGTVQRDVGVLTEWRSGKARLRPGDFAQFSAQNSQDYGTVSCKIVEHMPDGSVRRIAPVTTSSGAFAIVDCNGTVK